MSDKRRSKPENLKGTALRLLRMILKYKIRFFTACVCMAISSAAAVRGTYYLKPLVDDYFVPMIGKAVGDPSLSSAFTAFTSTALQGAVSLVILMVVFFLISMVVVIKIHFINPKGLVVFNVFF